MELWHVLQSQHMPEIIDLLRSLVLLFPEEVELYLPSFFSDGRYANTSLGLYEGKLRKGQACDALAELKFTLIHKTVLVRTKRKEACGVTLNTRGKKFIHHVAKTQDVMMSKYTLARTRLMNLKVTTGLENSGFPPLTEADLWRPGYEGLDAQLDDGS